MLLDFEIPFFLLMDFECAHAGTLRRTFLRQLRDADFTGNAFILPPLWGELSLVGISDDFT